MNKDQPRTLDKDISSAIRASRWHDARDLLEQKLGSFPLDLLARQKLTSVLIRAERWDEAITSAHKQLKLQPRDAGLIKKLLMLVLKHGGLSSDSSSVARADGLVATALTFEPDDGLLLRLAGQVAILSGRTREATTILSRALVAEPGDLIARVLLTELLSDKGDPAGSADIFEEALRLRPSDPRLWRTAVSVRQRAGRTAAALEAQRTSVALRLPSIAADLEEGLRGVSGDPVTLPPRMLDWAWSLQLANGLDPSTSRETWRHRVQWGMDADDLMLDWLEVHPDRWRDVARRTELRGVDLLEEAVRSGQGAYLSIAHLGPIHGMFCALQETGLPFRWVSSASSLFGGPIYERLISTKDEGRRAVLPSMHETFRKGQILVAAADTDGRRPPSEPFEGLQIRINETAIRMAVWARSTSLFMESRWQDGRMIYEVRRMAQPESRESADAYVKRWKLDYLAHVKAALLSDPANLRCRGGLWGSISIGASSNTEGVGSVADE